MDRNRNVLITHYVVEERETERQVLMEWTGRESERDKNKEKCDIERLLQTDAKSVGEDEEE